MKKLIGKLIINKQNFNPFDVKFKLRDIAKTKFNYYYFQQAKKAKNIGCVLFGQKDTWKGLYSQTVEEQDNKFIVSIFIDTYRTDLNTLDKCEGLLRISMQEFTHLKKCILAIEPILH